MKSVLLVIFMTFSTFFAHSQVSQIVGNWKTVDDKTGNSYAVVTIYRGDDGLYYGKITRILYPEAEQMVCTQCTGDDYRKPLVGLVILRNLHEKNGELVGGRCLDPESGKFYYGKVYLKDGRLVLRGSLDKHGILGRNQIWLRAK